MKFVKGVPFKGCIDHTWYLYVDGKMRTFEFTCTILQQRMAINIFDPHNQGKTPDFVQRICIEAIPKIQMALLMGERDGWYMNAVGGMCPTLYDIIDETEADTWPDTEHIKIFQWPRGSHYYVKVDGVDVVDEEGNQKWKTAKAARLAAEQFCMEKIK